MTLTLDQHAQRRRGIGASEIAAVVGVNPWSSPIDVWQDKVDPLEPKPSTMDTERGNRFEPVLRQWYADITDREVSEPGTLVHPDHDIVIATPDGISHGPDGDIYVEIKSPGYHTMRHWGRSGTDEVPEYYWPQVQWGMAATGLTRAHVVAEIYGELRIYTVDFDPDLFKLLLTEAKRFWADHVVPRKAPAVDASTGYIDYLRRKYPNADEEVVLSQTTLGNKLANKFRVAKEKLRAAEARVRERESALKVHMGEAVLLDTDIGPITWRNNRETLRTDWRGVAKFFNPSDELVAKHTTVQPGPRVFRADFRSFRYGTAQPTQGEAE